MKILVISNLFPPGFIGGYELGAFDVVRNLVLRGHVVKVATSDYFVDESGELSYLDIDRSLENVLFSHQTTCHTTQQECGTYYSYNNIRKLGSIIRRFEPDVVILFNIAGLGCMGLIQFLEKIEIPSLLYFMDTPFAGVDRKSTEYNSYVSIFGELQLSNNMRIVAMSRSLMNEINKSLGFGADKVVYIPGWIELSANHLTPTSKVNDSVRFVFSSSITPHKGTEILVDAVNLLVRNGFKRFTVDVYGQGQVTQFLQSIRMMGLDKYIQYHGSKKKDEMVKLFSQYDALLFPTWEREPFGFVVSEAASAGCFPIMTAGIGAGDWFNDGVDCIKIARTSGALMKAMAKTISMTDEERMRLRNAAMQSARQNFASEKWMTVIEQLCLDMQSVSTCKVFAQSRQIQSAFLFLGEMWRQSLYGKKVVSEGAVSGNVASPSHLPSVATKNPLEKIFWEYGNRHAKLIKKLPFVSKIAEKIFFKIADKK